MNETVEEAFGEKGYMQPEYGRVILKPGKKLLRIRDLTPAQELRMHQEKPPVFSSPGCRHCHGIGHEGVASRQDKITRALVTSKIPCRCLMVMVDASF